MRTIESQASNGAREELAWDPDWEVGVFTCMLQCPTCREVSVAAGTYRVVEDGMTDRVGQEPEQDYAKDLTVQFFSVPPHVFQPPAKCPPDAVEHLVASFGLYWQDPEAAANRVRAAIEVLLTHLRVPQTYRDAKGKRHRWSLHERIKKLPASRAQYRDLLMAVKWIGNSGSHGRPVTGNDLLDGYQLLEHVLIDLFSKPGVRANSLAREINRRKAPRSKRR